ncbi:MAG: site-2 protease family protein, partial [Ktedonobacteraceae bacterium]
MMHWEPDDFSEYGKTPNDTDYANPTFYQQDTVQKANSAQRVQSLAPLDAHSDYAHGPTVVNSYDPALAPEYREYSGPANIEGYTTDAGTEQRDAAARGTTEGGSRRKGLAGLGGLGAILAALLKFQWLAVFMKFGFAGISAIVSIVVYSFLFGWPFAVGLVALLFIHEMGHAIVMKLKGLPVGGMIFIPMLGAAVFMRQMPKNARDEAEVGIAGPIAGALSASVCLLIALQSPHVPSIWAPLAYFGFFINLFNLIPIVPFDGGRVLAAIDRRIWIVGFLGLVAFQIWSWVNGNFSPWLLFFVIMAGTQMWARRSVPSNLETKSYYNVPLSERIILGVIYFGLAAVLVFGMSISHN